MQTSKTWIPFFDQQRQTLALDQSRTVAARLSDSARITAAIADAGDKRPLHGAPNADLAIAFAALNLALPDQGFDRLAHTHLLRAVESKETLMSPGIVGGLAQLGFAALMLSAGGTRYQRLLTSIDAALAAEVERLIAKIGSSTEYIETFDYDQISGLSGIGAYLLSRDRDSPPLRRIVETLVELVRRDRALSAFCVLAEGTSEPQINCGLAHGVPGVLAFLSLASLQSVHVEGLPEAISGIGDWLIEKSTHDAFGIAFAAAVPIKEASSVLPSCARTAWCYGNPGVARALWLAGRALAREDWCRLAQTALLSSLQRPATVQRIDSPNFCHGVAGLLQIVLRFQHDAPTEAMQTLALRLFDDLAKFYKAETLLGFQDTMPGNTVDDCTLLNGAAGVLLVLLSCCSNAEPVWDRFALLY